jgi:hypothetical protein
MRPRALVPIVLSALVATGCGAAESSTSFEGQEKEVADVVEALQGSAERSEAEEICTDLLTEELQKTVSAGKLTCAAEMEKALDDADAFELEVQDVSVSGQSATARVKGTDEGDGVIRTLELVNEGGAWRISSFGSPGA